ncbi:DUF2130 domain-containing protein [Mycoplasmopsis ciconiae]|uniref:DUF2130 domain-containing protein n=1 Tax=Mycoplasmopsis ciconiae TaxID=561067 RepID=A0ABU7MLP3_9BACT|nr:DUF2130 domain-containing protein [Mycoplasmopsis ciconiae]
MKTKLNTYVKAKLIDKDDLIFELTQDAKKGDLINIRALTSDVNLDFINEALEEFWNKEVENKTLQLKEKIKNSKEFKDIYKDIQEKNEKISELNDQIKQLQVDIKSSQQSYKNELKNQKDELQNQIKKENDLEKLNYQKEINKITFDKEVLQTKLKDTEQQIISLEEKHKNILEQEKKNWEEKQQLKLNKEISDIKNALKLKENECENLNDKLNNLEKILNLEHEKAIQQKQNEFEKEKMDLESQLQLENKRYEDLLEQIENRKKYGTKEIGELGEEYVKNSLEEEFSGFDFLTINKTTNNINGSKPDFLIEFWDSSFSGEKNDFSYPKIGECIIEVKTKATDEGSTKISSHLAKFEKDRRNFSKNPDTYGLLVTDLEPKLNFLFKMDPKYPRIIIVRFEALVPLVRLIHTMILKESKMKIEQVNLKDTENLIKEWEDLKDDIFKNSFKNLNSHINDSVKLISDSIDKLTKAKDEHLRIALFKNMKTIENKINGFNLQNKTKKLENKIKATEVIEVISEDDEENEAHKTIHVKLF